MDMTPRSARFGYLTGIRWRAGLNKGLCWGSHGYLRHMATPGVLWRVAMMAWLFSAEYPPQTGQYEQVAAAEYWQ